MEESRRGEQRRVGTRVAVASDQLLVAEAVRAALLDRGFEAVPVRWPHAQPTVPAHRQPGLPQPDVGLMVSDFDRPNALRSARWMIDQMRVPWVVLCGAPRGTVWGALLDSGAAVVLPASTPLDEAVDVLRNSLAGSPATEDGGRQELIDEWREVKAQREGIAARIASLSPREREVLTRMYAGESVRDIAQALEVSEWTVRSQVKSILRKLSVKSQLGAVAAVAHLQELGQVD
jgi:RNA polymerase sigma factor (sigma-70 family)